MLPKMPLRKAAAYSRHSKKAYTRKSTVRSKNYIKAVPGKKVTKYIMGDLKKFEAGRYPFIIYLLSEENIYIRDNAIEAARQYVHRLLDTAFKGNYYFLLHTHPHHVLRENKMLTGAGADRMQTGMSQSFGVPVGISAHVRTGEKIFTIAVQNKTDVPLVRKTLNSCKSKLPGSTRIFTPGDY